jgi:hypothetical protein
MYIQTLQFTIARRHRSESVPWRLNAAFYTHITSPKKPSKHSRFVWYARISSSWLEQPLHLTDFKANSNWLRNICDSRRCAFLEVQISFKKSLVPQLVIHHIRCILFWKNHIPAKSAIWETLPNTLYSRHMVMLVLCSSMCHFRFHKAPPPPSYCHYSKPTYSYYS